MKKTITKTLTLALAGVFVLAGCTATPSTGDTAKTDFDTAKEITVISREDGSGTRGAFTELFEIIEKDDSGKKVDKTTVEAMITNSTSVMMTSVESDKYAIGYISLGSLNDSIKALKIDGTEATAANVKSGTYKVSRPFNIAVSDKASDTSSDFIEYILSTQGQAIVEKAGYIAAVENAKEYTASGKTGKIVVAGSSSVTPAMVKLKEAYEALNSGVSIELQESDSTTGMTSAIDGVCDIGMASRELKDSELEKLTPTVIAIDGIAVITNKANTVADLTTAQVKGIFKGEHTTWADLTK